MPALGPEGAAPGDAHQIAVLIVAAGESHRMVGVDKIFAPLSGLPLIVHTVETFESSPVVGEICLVLAPDRVERGRELALSRSWGKLAPERVCAGGDRRQDSVMAGLETLRERRDRWVAVHDGARPCIPPGLLERGLEAAQETGAAVAAVPAKDTIKVVSPRGVVESTPDRDTLWMVQTPQLFKYDLLADAHRACPIGVTVTDDAAMVERMGHRVKVFMGSYSNLKVTTPEDLKVAEALLRSRVGPHASHSGRLS